MQTPEQLLNIVGQGRFEADFLSGDGVAEPQHRRVQGLPMKPQFAADVGKAALPIFIKYRRVADPLYPPNDFATPPGISWSRGGSSADGAASGGFPYITAIPPRSDGGGGGGEDSTGEQLMKNEMFF